MIQVTKRVRFDPFRFIIVNRRGVLYDLGGEDVELFTVRVLAEALDRSRDTVLTWERRGHLPPPLFRVERPRPTERDGDWRMYSATQVVNANTLALRYFGKRRRIDDRRRFAEFVGELRRVWYAPSVIVASTPSRAGEAAGLLREGLRGSHPVEPTIHCRR